MRTGGRMHSVRRNTPAPAKDRTICIGESTSGDVGTYQKRGRGGGERETKMHTPSHHHSHTRTYRFVTRDPYHEEALLFTTGDDSTGSYMADGDTGDSTTTSSPTSSSSMSSTTGKAGSDAPSKLPTPRTPRESRGACDVAWHRIRRWSREICHGIGCQGYDR